MGTTIASCQLFALFVAGVRCSLYDPHLFPTSGPYFEGWYFRFIDFTNRRSFATLFGKVLPKEISKSHNLAYFGLLRQNGMKGKLLNFDTTPKLNDVHLTVRGGKKITENPGTKTPAHFEWNVKNIGDVIVNPTHARVNITMGGVHLEADIGAPRVWDDTGRGPMGWLTSLPIPLSWFVYSLGSPVRQYKWTELKSGKSVSGTGFVHMEKNWGRTFPEGWIWAEGMNSDRTVVFAATYGPVGFGPVGVPGHLIGYRNYEKQISVDFRPDNSYLSKTFDGCTGFANFTLHSVSWKLTIDIRTAPDTYSECLLGPMTNGFDHVCQESYVGHAQIKVYKRKYLSYQLVDEQQLDLVALEFGGTFSCNNVCVVR